MLTESSNQMCLIMIARRLKVQLAACGCVCTFSNGRTVYAGVRAMNVLAC